VFGRLQADTVAAVWTAAAAIHREKNTVETAAAAGLQPQRTSRIRITHVTRIKETFSSDFATSEFGVVMIRLNSAS
jgi:hypothetical protein